MNKPNKNIRYEAMIDTETGGLYSTYHALTEVGIVIFHKEFKDGTVHLVEDDCYNKIVLPDQNKGLTLKALDVQHRTLQEILDKGVEEEQVFDEVVAFMHKWLGTDYQDYTGRIWGDNAEFDSEFMYQFNARNKARTETNLMFKNKCNWNCVKAVFRLSRSFGNHDRWATSLDNMMEHYGLKADSTRHLALNDARYSLKVLESIFNEMRFGEVYSRKRVK
jgi:inhibitor of KinA sporulation pathway (predicted exonuclease)